MKGRCIITANNKIVDVAYRVKSSPPRPFVSLSALSSAYKTAKQWRRTSKLHYGFSSWKKKKKKKVKAWKQPRHSHSCLIIPAIREQSIFRFSTTVRHPFVAWKFNWKTEGSRFRENFLPLFLSFFRDLFPNDKKIAKTWTRFNRVLFL